MSLKVFQLAKELGVDSKAIVHKCKDEGVPKIDTHISPVSAGLAETIREWFHAGALKTAVEATEHVDLEKAKKRRSPAKKGRKKDGEGEQDGEGDGGATTAVAEPPVVQEEAIVEQAPAVAEPEVQPVEPPPVIPTAAAAILVPEAPPEEIAPEAPAAAVAAPVPAEKPAPAPEAPHKPKEPTAAPLPAAATAAPAKVTPVAPVKEVPVKPVRPPVSAMGIPNVPRRPDSVVPMGQKLVVKPAVLKGPEVVRMEQPDHLPAPRRRPMPSSGPSQGQGQNQGQNQGPSSGPAGPGTRTGGVVPASAAGATGHGRAKGKFGEPAVDDEESRGLKRPLKGRSARRHGGRSADAGVDLMREWREADLAEREERISTSGGLLRERKRELSKTQQRQQAAHSPAQRSNKVEVTPPLTIRELSEAMGVKATDIVKKLMAQGVMATVNQSIEVEMAQVMALEYGLELIIKARESALQAFERQYREVEEKAERVPRAPVVTILGHVDHGKTSLLDKIRSANVAAGEAGGITQHVGAYTVEVVGGDGKSKRVTFLDTPGHQAFTAMRARGANMTDVVVLVVAADDGVMPQTIESIAHAKAAGVPIVVAMNKIDKAEANPNKVLGQLAEQGLNPAEWGGDTEVVRTSAVSGQGVKELIEYLDYTATLKELKASPTLPARGAVIEAFMDPNRGVVARVLVQNGTLHVGDTVVCGATTGRVRSITDDKGVMIEEALPAAPVEVIGLDEVPAAGDKFYAVEDPDEAKTIAEEQQRAMREGEIAKRSKVTLENLFDEIQKGDVKELPMILKADVQGSVDVLRSMMTEELSKEVKVRLLHSAVGGISESDVLLAEASGAIIVGFSVVPDETARKLAEDLGVEVRLYRIIYEITDDIRKALTGMLAPSKQDQTLGHAEVRQVIKVSRVGNVIGCMVTDGVLQRNNKYRLIRDGAVVQENLTLDSLKRFKEDVKEVRGGLECGVKLAGYDDVKVGDRLEAYKTVDVARTL